MTMGAIPATQPAPRDPLTKPFKSQVREYIAYKCTLVDVIPATPSVPRDQLTKPLKYPELGTRQYCRDNETMFSGHKVVWYCNITLFGVATPSRHQADLNCFRFFSGSGGSITLSHCGCRKTLKLSRAQLWKSRVREYIAYKCTFWMLPCQATCTNAQVRVYIVYNRMKKQMHICIVYILVYDFTSLVYFQIKEVYCVNKGENVH